MVSFDMPPRPLKPTVVLPDPTPLILLAAADALHLLTAFGRVVVVDIIALEATYHRYSRDEIPAWRAAAALGDDATVADVISMLKANGLQPPQQDPKQAAIELERARRVLGLG